MARVLIIGDTHCSAMRRGYIAFLKQIAEEYETNRVVHIGDMVDWSSISFHEKSPALSSALSEFKATKRQVAALVRAFPEADIMLGNHDELPRRQATTVGLPSEVLRNYNDLWEIDWKVHPRFSKLIIDGVIYSHGDSGRGGMDAALTQARNNFQSTVIGHFHSQASIRWWANSEFRVFGLSTGCGFDYKKLQFEYGKRFVAKPILGCGVILGGKRAYFEPMILKSR